MAAIDTLKAIPAPVLIGGGVALVALLYLRVNGAGNVGRQIGGGAVDLVGGLLSGAVDALPEPIRPTSKENIAYRGVNAVGEAISGERDWTLGGWIYEITH